MMKNFLLFVGFILLTLLTSFGYVSSEAVDSQVLWKSRASFFVNSLLKYSDAGQVITRALNYNYTIDPFRARKGLGHLGGNARLRKVLRQALFHKKDLKIGLVGGSISCGHGTDRGKEYLSVFTQWLNQTFHENNITSRNGCVPGTPSSFMVVCFNNYVDPDVDVIFVEYILNDGNTNGLGYERLLRLALQLPKKPAVIMVQVISHGMAHDAWEQKEVRFFQTVEDKYGVLAQYYDIPVLSLRDEMYDMARFGNVTGLRWGDIMLADRIHPSNLGHQLLTDMIVNLFQHTLFDVVISPTFPDEERWLNGTLVPPMYAGNYASGNTRCFFQTSFKGKVSKAAGWDWINDGNNERIKLGYVTTTPGSSLQLKLDTRPFVEGHQSSVSKNISNTTIHLIYLSSYEHMGMANVSCENCACTPTVIDAHSTKRESQLRLATVVVGAHESCLLNIKSLDATHSDGHKLRVSGVVMDEVMASGKAIYNMNGMSSWDRFAESG